MTALRAPPFRRPLRWSASSVASDHAFGGTFHPSMIAILRNRSRNPYGF